MKKTVVVYKSHYGFTKTYAKWLSESLKCDIFEASKVNKKKLLDYDIIIFGGGLYASGIGGFSLITKNFDTLKEKDLVVFTVGLADPQIKEQFEPIIKKNFTDEMKQRIKIFHLRGGIDYKKLGFVHKKMMGMMNKMLLKKPEAQRTDEDVLFIKTYGDRVDFSDKGTIEPILSYLNSLI